MRDDDIVVIKALKPFSISKQEIGFVYSGIAPTISVSVNDLKELYGLDDDAVKQPKPDSPSP